MSLRLKIARFLEVRRDNRNLQKALRDLSVPEVPEEVRATWYSVPAVAGGLASLRSVKIRLVGGLAAILAVLLVAFDSKSAIASALEHIAYSKPPSVPLMESLISRFGEQFVGVTIGILFGGLIAYFFTRHKNLPFKFYLKTALLIFLFWAIYAVANSGVLPPVVRLAVGMVFSSSFFSVLIWLTAIVLVQTAKRDMRSYPRHLLWMVILSLAWFLSYAAVSQMLKGFPIVVWLVALILGWMLTPLFSVNMRVSFGDAE